jgi:hypothetical protein
MEGGERERGKRVCGRGTCVDRVASGNWATPLDHTNPGLDWVVEKDILSIIKLEYTVNHPTTNRYHHRLVHHPDHPIQVIARTYWLSWTRSAKSYWG